MKKIVVVDYDLAWNINDTKISVWFDYDVGKYYQTPSNLLLDITQFVQQLLKHCMITTSITHDRSEGPFLLWYTSYMHLSKIHAWMDIGM